LAWPMCSRPFGSGGKRVITRPLFLPDVRSCDTISRMKSRGAASALGVVMSPQLSPKMNRMRTQDPYALFRKWFTEAVKAGTKLPEAMALATATRAGVPSVRMVLNRGIDRRGFAFFTNYNSRKAAELVSNPRAAVVFHWPLLERQVRAGGRVRKLTRAESDRYFEGRPRESRLSAWVSPQSEEIPDRAYLEAAFARAQTNYAGKRIPRPPFWGGFRLIPDEIEFWQGQPYRLHDRVCYRKTTRGWDAVKLAP
jgi:pyridoxamine 5'-phosphate oxidase